MDSQETVNTSPSLTYSAEPEKKSFSRKNLILIIFFVLVLAGIPAATFMLQRTQILQSKASTGLMATNFKLPNQVTCDFTVSPVKCNTTTQVFNIELVSAPDEFTPYAAATAAPTATPVPATATPGPTVAATATPAPVGPTTTPAPAAATSTPVKLAQPSGLAKTCRSDGTGVTLNWNPVPGATAYDTRVKNTSKNGLATGSQNGLGNASTEFSTISGDSYEIQVWASPGTNPNAKYSDPSLPFTFVCP